jgi:hypothetical protein
VIDSILRESAVNKKSILKAAGTIVFAGMVLGGPAASAADLVGSQGDGDGAVAGNAVDGNVDAPVAACGVGAVGGGVATGACDASGPLASSSDDMTSAIGSGSGVIAGNAIAVAADAPIAACGVAAGALGVASGACKATGPLADTGDGMTTAMAKGDGVLTGNAIDLDADAPVAVCGVGVPVVAGVGTGACKATGPLASSGKDTTAASAEGDGVLAGNAIAGDLDVPIAACGLAAGLAGVDTGTCDAKGPLATTGDDTTSATAQGDGVGTGNAVAIDGDVPVAACGGGVALLGVATGACG